MRTRNILCLLALVCSCVAVPRPQDQVTAEDILSSSDSKRYGDSPGNLDPDALGEIFGTNTNSNQGNEDNYGSTNTDNTKNTVDDTDDDDYDYYFSPSDDKKNHEDFGEPSNVKADQQHPNCSDYAEEHFSCVPYYQCKDGLIITDGEGLFDIRSGLSEVFLDPANSKCPGYLEVCCQDPDYYYDDDELPEISTPKPVTTTRKPDTTTQKIVTSRPYVSKCGRRNTGGIGVRIQNEHSTGNTQFGEFPHMCAVLNLTVIGGEEINLYVSGGSLIAPGVVLTAAQHVKGMDPSIVKVRCGEWDTQSDIEPVKHQDRRARAITIHPTYNERNLHNDYALIFMEEEFIPSAHVDVMCLPDQVYPDESYIPENCIATGWGRDKFGKEGQYQVVLKQVEMDLVPHDECQERLRESRLGNKFKLDSSFTCAGGQPGRDTCTGDGGGPLICPVPGRNDDQTYVQVGIVAWGVGCGDNFPGVYVNVSQELCFMDWATKCQEGRHVDHYGYTGCERWAKRVYCGLKDDVYLLEKEISDPSYSLKQRRRSLRKKKKIEKQLPYYVDAILSCPANYEEIEADIDCDDLDYLEGDVDVSSLARKGQEEKKDAPLTKAIEDEVDESDPRTEDIEDDDSVDDTSRK